MPVRVLLGIAMLALWSIGPAQGQSAVQVEAQVDAYTIGSEERITYSLQIQGAPLASIRTPEPPPTSNLVLLNATPATEQHAHERNGRSERVVTFSWRYRPMRLGTATFDPVTVQIGTQTVSTGTIDVEVVPQSTRTGMPPTGHGSGGASEAARGPQRETNGATEPLISDDDLFIDVTPADTAVFVGEQVPIEYRLYFRPGIRLRQSRLAEAWEAPGFWREELEVNGQPQPDTPNATYRYIVIKRVATFPTRAGSLRVRPLRVETEATPGLGMATADQIMPMQRAFEDLMLASPPVQVTAQPVPEEDAPASFRGAVGAFQWERRPVPSDVAVGEGLSVTLTVEGTGNLYAVEAPPLRLPQHVDVMGPRTETTFERTQGYLHGTRTFTYTLVPRTAEPFVVPALSWSHFDPEVESFITHNAKAVPVHVQPRDNAPNVSPAEQSPAAQSSPNTGGWFRWALLLSGTLTLGAAGAWAYWKWGAVLLTRLRRSPTQEQRTSGPQGSTQEDAEASQSSGKIDTAAADPAMKQAQIHLDAAQHALRAGTTAAFYRALERAVVELVAQRLNRSPNGLARHELFAVLDAHGIDRPVRETAEELLHACDQARFSPAHPSHDSRLAALDAAHTLVLHLDAALPEGRPAVAD
ncbi:hypothetical protein CRI93_13545 [Longimonas halophila]|uniref:Protein BatD n=1 Tax=Longimonas halophila TaxID=1469170 RepID=A0A2H3P4B2_9BACT|nr:BatD family protein [Longimonas halophila]PEN05229.1 hypothetical protein CRI93_13545 [Longimonas halophila]